MKKQNVITMFVMLVAITFQMNAQKIDFGAKLGFNLSTFTGDLDDVKSLPGFHVGSIAEIKFSEKNRYIPGIRNFVGFKQKFIVFDRPDRLKGEVYGLRALFMYNLLQAHAGYSASGELLGVPALDIEHTILMDVENGECAADYPRWCAIHHGDNDECWQRQLEPRWELPNGFAETI